jgi:dihydropteroate synthase
VNSVKTLNFRGKLFSLDRPKVMGILNLTEDSFFEGSRLRHFDSLLDHVQWMIQDGADIIDLGAQSTRPGSSLISADAELKKIVPAIELIREHFSDIPISIDTFYGSVAERAIDSGADMINDISAYSMDSRMFETISRLKVPYILMHIKGTPQTMQQEAIYSDVSSEVIHFLSKKLNELKISGMSDIILDPGFGSAKNFEHNKQLFRDLEGIKSLGQPILVGISRKKMIQHILDTNADGALNGTTAAHMLALQRGADILRVHDVKEARQTIEIFMELH